MIGLTPSIVRIDGPRFRDGRGEAGRLTVCVGTEQALDGLVTRVLSKGACEIDRQRRRDAVWQPLGSLRRRLAGERSGRAHLVALFYRDRMLATLIVDHARSSPAIATLPYFGEYLDAADFRLQAGPDARGDGHRHLRAVIVAQSPRLSGLEQSIQRRVPDASVDERDTRGDGGGWAPRRWIVHGPWATAAWVVRSAASPSDTGD